MYHVSLCVPLVCVCSACVRVPSRRCVYSFRLCINFLAVCIQCLSVFSISRVCFLLLWMCMCTCTCVCVCVPALFLSVWCMFSCVFTQPHQLHTLLKVVCWSIYMKYTIYLINLLFCYTNKCRTNAFLNARLLAG